jgi:hypothetical protein
LIWMQGPLEEKGKKGAKNAKKNKKTKEATL